MRANSLSTTTGETLLSDVDAALVALREGKSSRNVDKNASTVTAQTESEVIGARRTVTNASMDTLTTPRRRNRARWMMAGGFAAGAAVAVMGLITVGKTKELTADSPPPVSSAAAVAPSAIPSATTSPPVASASPSASVAPDAVGSSASHAPDPHRKPKPSKGSPHPSPTGKQVDFGY